MASNQSKENHPSTASLKGLVPWWCDMGGPGTWYPRWLESFLSWSLALSCLSVSGYHFIRMKLGSLWKRPNKDCWIPLTTSSRSEQQRCTPKERLQQLITYLEKTTFNQKKKSILDATSQEWTDAIRVSKIARRLVTLALVPSSSSQRQDDNNLTPQEREIKSRLEEIYPFLLSLPTTTVNTRKDKEDKQQQEELKNVSPYKFELSVIVPAYFERNLARTLDLAIARCQDASQVQILISNAACRSKNNNNNDVLDKSNDYQDLSNPKWGDFQVINFTSGGGRGPCLNFGARHAQGRILVFLHADTTLPHHWDVQIKKCLLEQQQQQGRATCCAFSFGIDIPKRPSVFPPGIYAVQTTANWRTQWWSLPYGDQVLSVEASVFDFVGGFPDQCLFEDYEFVSLIRTRVARLGQYRPTMQQQKPERLAILPGTALCSSRRWDRHGVLKVTYLNSKLVNLYTQSKTTPEKVYQLYYGKAPPPRPSGLAPWELELNNILENKDSTTKK